MAKQSGFHQVKGKVGEFSYYQQTGVVGGLIRRINQGLSEKVKTAEAFANTRLNNAEFGQAGRISSVLGMYITPKFRPMLLPFSQSKMAKVILDVIKTDSASWGQRNLTAQTIPTACVNALNSVAKGDFASFGIKISVDIETTTVVLTTDDTFISKLSAIDANGVTVRLVCCSPWIGTYMPGENIYAKSYARGINVDNGFVTAESKTLQYSLRPAPPQGWPAIYGNFMILIVLPYRTINNIDYTLQEQCTFHAFELIDGDAN